MFDDPEVCEAVILEYYRRPKNEGRCGRETHFFETVNPASGVELSVSLRIADGLVECARFDGGGCSVSTASASILVCLLEGKGLADAREILAAYRAMMGGGGAVPDLLGKAGALKLVRGLPDRLNSAMLACYLLEKATGAISGKNR